MDINDRIRAAYEEFEAAPEPKPTPRWLSLRWNVHVQLIEGALSLQQLYRVTEREEREPNLELARVPGRRGRRALTITAADMELTRRVVVQLGWEAAVATLRCSGKTLSRVLKGERGLGADLRERMEKVLDSKQPV